VYEPAGPNQGLSADCTPVALGSGTLMILTTDSSSGASASDPAGHFCTGQGGNAECNASGDPNPCCTGMGTGSCQNFDGCFGSGKFADSPNTCTSMTVTGSPGGFLLAGDPGSLATYGAVSCIPAVSAGGFSPLINGVGLPGPVLSSNKSTLAVH
jgi:hypothetical protein